MLNHITLMGRLVRDPELRITSNGTSVTSFTVAVNRDFDREKADFIDAVAWRQTAEFVEKHFRKGQQIVITGSLQIRDWTDKNGSRRTAPEINVDHVYFCGDARSKDNSAESEQRGAFREIDADDDGILPF